MGRLGLGGSLFGEEVLEDTGGLDVPYWRPRENGGLALSIRSGQRQGPTLSSVVCERPLQPTPRPYQRER